MTHFENLIRSILRFEPDREEALQRALEEILARFRSDTATLHLFDPARGILVLKAQIGLPPEIEEVTREIPLGKGIAGEAARTRQPVTMCNLQTDESGVARPAARKTGVGGALCVPICRGDELVGTLGIGTRREYTYTPEQTQDLIAIGKVIAEELAPAHA